MITAPPRFRLYVANFPAASGCSVSLSAEQAHYAVHVMRAKVGDTIALFNAHEGEWYAQLETTRKGTCTVILSEQTRPPFAGDATATAEPLDIWLAFAPLKKNRIDFVVEKATELGAAGLIPVITERTQHQRVNTARLRHTAREAAEQCARLSVPIIKEPIPLRDLLHRWPVGLLPDTHPLEQPEDRPLYMMDETGGGSPLVASLKAHTPAKAAILIGPEGGFTQSELDLGHNMDFVRRISLGPRLLRAETAAVTALAGWLLHQDSTNPSVPPQALPSRKIAPSVLP